MRLVCWAVIDFHMLPEHNGGADEGGGVVR